MFDSENACFTAKVAKCILPNLQGLRDDVEAALGVRVHDRDAAPAQRGLRREGLRRAAEAQAELHGDRVPQNLGGTTLNPVIDKSAYRVFHIPFSSCLKTIVFYLALFRFEK